MKKLAKILEKICALACCKAIVADFRRKKRMRAIGLALAAGICLVFLVIFGINFAQNNKSGVSLGFGSIVCREFEEGVLWTSGYDSQKDSENYQTWIPKTSCAEAGGQNCLLQDLGVNSRTMYVATDGINADRESYVQISNLDNSVCDNPRRGIYSTYLAQESVEDSEGQLSGWYCGKEKDATSECRIRLNDEFTEECYGIKAFASQRTIIDVFKIKYKWCWDKNGK